MADGGDDPQPAEVEADHAGRHASRHRGLAGDLLEAYGYEREHPDVPVRRLSAARMATYRMREPGGSSSSAARSRVVGCAGSGSCWRARPARRGQGSPGSGACSPTRPWNSSIDTETRSCVRYPGRRDASAVAGKLAGTSGRRPRSTDRLQPGNEQREARSDYDASPASYPRHHGRHESKPRATSVAGGVPASWWATRVRRWPLRQHLPPTCRHRGAQPLHPPRQEWIDMPPMTFKRVFEQCMRNRGHNVLS